MYLKKAIMMYGERSLLMFDNFTYFLGYIISTVSSGNLVRDYAFDSFSNRDAIQIYNTFMDAVK